ncbi:hypothetical protein BCR43DRAFT_566717 [Syncephalastrum racemosum]|uniref:Ceramide very long chain fatty acid hydroxylase n=1 Tax=Syncephalastrum racemosum TaxID=13706 RepID=A0A1X2H156_SYNRA|nr:hypothetical protein BCR43DRAFT_566717 [Syncephalastrum racemosum]
MSTFTMGQVLQHASESSCWFVYKGKVYDVTPFVRDHPGGQDILMPFAGTDVSDVLHDENLHVHSDAAYELLQEYYIGELVVSSPPSPSSSSSGAPSLSVSEGEDEDDELATVPDDDHPKGNIKHLQAQQQQQQQTQKPMPFLRPPTRDSEFLDLGKPLFPQLWYATWSKSFYLDQVHRPRFVSHYVPYFSNPWLDVLSRTTWYTVPLVWLPFVGYQLWRSVSCGLTLTTALQIFCLGVVFWSLLEYALHRFLFHLDDLLPDHPLALLCHFTLHGIHHHMPMDRLRLVMPPALTILIGAPVIQLTHQLLSTSKAHAFVAGAFFGYVGYDCIHYYLHHAQVIRIHFREMKRYHLAHHYKNYESGYGITSKIWDHIFGTVLESQA